MGGLRRLMPAQAAVRTTLSGMLGMHSCAYQLLDDNVSPSYLPVVDNRPRMCGLVALRLRVFALNWRRTIPSPT
jgi:hypothetical protein